jgi:GNAT superfamily N-acetyltransferase
VTAEIVRALEFEEPIRERCVDRRAEFPWGTAFFTPSLGKLWDMNLLRVDRPDGLGAATLAEEAERVQGEAGVAHRRVVVLDGDAGARLEPGFRELGWKVDRFLYMAHRRPPGRTAPPGIGAVEVEQARLAPLRRRIAQEEPSLDDEEAAEQILARAERVAAAARVRHFAVLEGDVVAASGDLYSDGRTAQIEDVGTLPERRGRGYATAVVLRALEEALAVGHDFVFLVADEDDWPKELYAKLGFDPIGRTYAFLKPPPR